MATIKSNPTNGSVCVACNAYYVGDNHHCSEDYERRRHAAENAERVEHYSYGTRLADGFELWGCND